VGARFDESVTKAYTYITNIVKMALQFNIRGFKEIEAALNRKIEAVSKGVDEEMDKAVLEINAKQVSYTPVDTGLLRESNTFDVSKPLNKNLRNNTEYAGYVEFGTGGLVNIPAGLEDTAITWKGAGVRQVNMRAQPFFFRAAFEEFPKMLARIKKIITK
jgi:hypothetical protein